MRSTFYVRLPDETLIESAPLAWRHAAPPPDNEAARLAYERLVERLLAEGWEREGQGAIWYETHFVRRGRPMATAPIAHEDLRPSRSLSQSARRRLVGRAPFWSRSAS